MLPACGHAEVSAGQPEIVWFVYSYGLVLAHEDVPHLLAQKPVFGDAGWAAQEDGSVLAEQALTFQTKRLAAAVDRERPFSMWL